MSLMLLGQACTRADSFVGGSLVIHHQKPSIGQRVDDGMTESASAVPDSDLAPQRQVLKMSGQEPSNHDNDPRGLGS
jgi:hypothetical protein